MRTLPPFIHKTTSNAERKLFKIIKESENLDNWYCLHSLGLSKHLSKREGEIDILLVGPAGVFVIEIKGGRVRRENGVWKFTDRYGRVSEKRESPFTQARSAMYSLRADLAQQFDTNINQYLFGYGVALPDIQFTTESPEWDLQTVFDVRDTNMPFEDYLNRLIGNWKSRQRSAKQLTKKEISEIVKYVRGDFETIFPISVAISDSEAEIIKLTDEQFMCLDAMAENKRVLFQGAAGTGKTLLAAEQAKRNEAQGIRTLLLCYNKFLAACLDESLNKTEKMQHVDVKTIHSFFHDTITQAGLEQGLKTAQSNDNNELYQQVYPELFNKAWSDEYSYDAIIIDEAQDVLSDTYINCLSRAVRGGIEDGRWTVFLDPENQKNMFLNLDEKTFSKLKALSVTYKLSINCRNTKPIAIQTEIISGIKAPTVNKLEGIPVRYVWFQDDADQANKVSYEINKLLDGRVSANDITILSPKRYSSSLAGSGRLRTKQPLLLLDTDNIRSERGEKIAYTSIQSYKGLESSVVILTDISELNRDWDKVVNYVGFTRARTALVVAVKSTLKPEYRNKLKELYE
ncbi:MAG TPA: NERD domain-containing protein/DEAD/DEAH box helicase [Verrucomicrobiae bacterium]|nr:NERD domain-containing protein/DEAD/DEAH box helicase [Verrucomicrobiae bacterium]